MHATEYLRSPGEHRVGVAVALAGSERFLKLEALKALSRVVLKGVEDDLAVTRFSGVDLELKTVVDALLTAPLWSPAQVVVVDEADSFVTEHRAGLEKYLERPAKKSVLVLDVKSMPATQKIAKKITEIGLILDCSALKGAQMGNWAAERARQAHGKKLDRAAAALLVELVGCEFGHIDQELAKLAAYAGAAESITSEAVEKLVGGWKTETTWKMADAIRDGHYAQSIELLDKLLLAGEPEIKLLGGINFCFRPAARAVELTRQGLATNEALLAAGAKPFNAGPLANYLKRIGRARAERIANFLLEADADLKGGSTLPGRVVLERLFLKLCGPRA